MPTAARTRCLPLPGAVVSTCVVMLVGLATHDLAGGAQPSAGPTTVAGLVIAAAFALVARGSVRPVVVAPLAAASQVLLHGFTDLSAAHVHHAGLAEAARCALEAPAMPVAHGIAVLVTVPGLLLVEPLLAPGSRRPVLRSGLVPPRLRQARARRSVAVVTRAAFAAYAPLRGPPELHVPA